VATKRSMSVVTIPFYYDTGRYRRAVVPVCFPEIDEDGPSSPVSKRSVLTVPSRRKPSEAYGMTMPFKRVHCGIFICGSTRSHSVACRAAKRSKRVRKSANARSAKPRGVPAFVIDRKIRGRLKAAACSSTRLATFFNPRTCTRRSPPVSYWCANGRSRNSPRRCNRRLPRSPVTRL